MENLTQKDTKQHIADMRLSYKTYFIGVYWLAPKSRKISGKICGAWGGNRTRTPLRTQDFKS